MSEQPLTTLLDGWQDVTAYIDPDSAHLCKFYGMAADRTVFIVPPAALLSDEARAKVGAGYAVLLQGFYGRGMPRAEDKVIIVVVKRLQREAP